MNDTRGKGRISGFFGHARQRGAAVLEFAVVAPLMFAIVFGIIEFGWRLMVKQTMVQASQVAARTASLPGSTDTDIAGAVGRYLEAAGYSAAQYDYTVSMVHATTEDPSESVTISIPMCKVSLTGFFGTPTGNMTVTTVVPKEGQL